MPVQKADAGPQSRTLEGRTVLVTRPPAESEEMAATLRSLGARVLFCPTIEIAEPDDWGDVDSAIDRLETYDWIVFTSANGVSYFFRRLQQRRGELSKGWSAQARVCAIGPRTEKALEAAGAPPRLVASDSRAEGVIEALTRYLGGADKLRGLSFLIPRSGIARDHLPIELSKLGARVDAVEAYKTVRPNTSEADAAEIKNLFEAGAIDAVTFTSSSTVSNLAALVGADRLAALMGDTTALCIGPVTAATAREYRIAKIVQPETYTARAMIDALARAVGDGSA
ncbi:MAG TPA: uroporphyrinogen-III synthase [Blastocatellia bacterium]|nr:uroporphyrinogen-III synthase [Blastocatellia bacterium]